MSRMQNRIDVLAEIDACERIRAFDETRLNLELRKAGVDPEGLTQWLERGLGIKPQSASIDVVESPQAGEDSPRQGVQPPLPALAPDPRQPVASAAAMAAGAPELGAFELAGKMKFFDARKGYGFFTADGDRGDVLVHILHLRAAGYQTAYEGARVHAMVHRTSKGLQVSRILSVDESSAIHPSQIPQRTREKVQAESDWMRARVKWYNCDKGYGFVCVSEGSPDCMVHADTLQRWGVAPLRPQQVVEIRWGMSSKGRMAAEIRYPGGFSGLPPVH